MSGNEMRSVKVRDMVATESVEYAPKSAFWNAGEGASIFPLSIFPKGWPSFGSWTWDCVTVLLIRLNCFSLLFSENLIISN